MSLPQPCKSHQKRQRRRNEVEERSPIGDRISGREILLVSLPAKEERDNQK